MTSKPIYTCSSCGKEHEVWPALCYNSPTAYQNLSAADQQQYGQLDADFCIITYPDQTDRFIRITYTQQVIDHCENLEYGLWVSLNETSFQDYADHFGEDDHENKYFGWLSNALPEYDFSKGSIPTTVYTRPNQQRPYIIPHDDFDHPFVHDYYNGITKEEAERRVQEMLQQNEERDIKNKQSKPWWKFW